MLARSFDLFDVLALPTVLEALTGACVAVLTLTLWCTGEFDGMIAG